MEYRSTSYWFDTLGSEPKLRPSVPGDIDVDVVILGAGFTGLWTAYYLAIADPSLQIAVIERDIAGFGASGRNGGWCSAMLEGMDELYERDPQGGARLRETLIASVSEIGNVCRKEEIEADYHLGGGLIVATDEPQAIMAREGLEDERAMGWTEDDIRWLEPDEVKTRLRAASIVGAIFQKHVAAINPAKLVRGLADVVERRGVTIYEQTAVTGVAPGQVQTSHGVVRARRIVMALNAYSAEIPGHKRDFIPIYNHMFATEPFSDALWDEIGLQKRGLFGDHSRLFTYAQRTADNRIAIGGRMTRYHFGSGINPRFDHDPSVVGKISQALREMLPQLGDFKITHDWGGVLAIPRNMITMTSFDPKTGIASAGGYTGEGVCATNMAGRTLRDLILERDTELTALPWVGPPSRRWEPEPIRWLGVNAGISLCRSADYFERVTGRPARTIDRIMNKLGMY
jgi:glycine/D-amino acid oxidase-like deaminating enzyme